MLKFSFILPCYNVAPYIGRCLESIEHQDIPQEEYEVICVDDCSPDNTGDVIREYQQRYPNIVYHRHETNKTAGGARNTGIELANGKYIWFVDPDDAIESNVLHTIVDRAERLHTDILSFNIIVVNEKGNACPSINMEDVGEVLTGQEFILRHHSQNNLYSLTTVYKSVYSRNFILENNIRYPEIKSSQDVVFVWKSILLAQRMSSIDTLCYRYIRRQNSMTGSKGKKKANATLSASILYSYELQNILNTFIFEDKCIVDTIKKDIRGSVNGDSRPVLQMNSQEIRKFYNGLKEHTQELCVLQSYMNRKTQNIFNYHLPYCLWRIMIGGYQIAEKIKK